MKKTMRFLIATCILFTLIGNGVCSVVDNVDPMIGTKVGNTYPAVCMPFGMTAWTPQTTIGNDSIKLDKPWRKGVPYDYDLTTIQGFRGSHYPSGACMGEYGSVTIMPCVGKLVPDAEGRASKFSHANEVATPYYYKVTLDDYNILAELTATTRSGFLRFTFPASKNSYILIDTRSGEYDIGDNKNNISGEARRTYGYVEIFPDKAEIVGYNPAGGRSHVPSNFAGYFVIKFDRPFSSYGTWIGKEIHEKSTLAWDERVGAYVGYDTEVTGLVEVKVGTSFISIDQARSNLEKEISDLSFEAVKERTKNVWNEALGRVELKGGSREERIIFYTALYHSLLLPRIFDEYGKYYSAFDGKVHEGVSYNDFSLWDTYRAQMPLLTIIEPEKVNDMITALIQMYKEGGWLPKWPNPGYSNVMIGTHADSVIADAYLKGIRDFDVEKAFEAMYKNAMTPPDGPQAPRYCDTQIPPAGFEARGGLSYYKKLGYVPSDRVAEATSRTLEFAYDDFCIAQMAKAIGKKSEYEILIERAGYYKNIFDTEAGFARGRLTNGSWANPFKPDEWYDYFTEGTSWHYTWYVPQDVKSLIKLMGGKKQFIEKLDTLFKKKLYWHGNEPSHHISYLYDYAGVPWKTQERVRVIMENEYGTGPAGLCGDEDCGQMSAWYIFSAIGFYPVCPGDCTYEIGSPVFEEVIIHLNSKYHAGKQFAIRAENVSKENKYIQSISLNGKPLNMPWIRHTDIINGGELVFKMGKEPNMSWGIDDVAMPPSMSDAGN